MTLIKYEQMMNLRILICIWGIICTTFSSFAQIEGWSSDNGDGTFTNPILWGDWPDSGKSDSEIEGFSQLGNGWLCFGTL